MSKEVVLELDGMRAGFPKTSGSRGIHINVPIESRWSFEDVRRAPVALAREMEMPCLPQSGPFLRSE